MTPAKTFGLGWANRSFPPRGGFSPLIETPGQAATAGSNDLRTESRPFCFRHQIILRLLSIVPLEQD